MCSIDLADLYYSQRRYDDAIAAVSRPYGLLSGWGMRAECLRIQDLMQRSLDERSL